MGYKIPILSEGPLTCTEHTETQCWVPGLSTVTWGGEGREPCAHSKQTDLWPIQGFMSLLLQVDGAVKGLNVIGVREPGGTFRVDLNTNWMTLFA